MPQADSANTTTLPVTRQQIEAQVDALIDLLDTLDADPDLEPSLGWQTGNQSPEQHHQDAIDFHGDANSGDDREDEDEREPPEDGEPSLGWTSQENQAAAYFHGNGFHGTDNEDGTGPVRKKRPPSKTGGAVYRGTAVLGLSEPPRNPRTVRMPMANPKRRAAR